MGFYYNDQLKRVGTRITLHPNTHLEGKEWVKYPMDSSIVFVNSGMGSTHYDFPYRKKPIATAIINEDFQIQCRNSWTEVGGLNNVITDVFNGARQYVPFLSKLGGLKDKIDFSKWENNKYASGLITWINETAEKVSEISGKAANLMNNKLISRGTMFTYYDGTTYGLSNLNMKFTVFADYVEDFDNNNQPTGVFHFKTVKEQLAELYTYAFGGRKDFHFSDFIDVVTDKEKTSEKSTEPQQGKSGFAEVAEKAGGAVEQFFEWQVPPGGYKATFDSYDSIQFGTLRLEIGNFFCLENLVIDSMDVVYSKVNCKNPEANSEYERTPLYADVSISFKTATQYTLDMVKKSADKDPTNVDIMGNRKSYSKYKQDKAKKISKLYISSSGDKSSERDILDNLPNITEVPLNETEEEATISNNFLENLQNDQALSKSGNIEAIFNNKTINTLK